MAATSPTSSHRRGVIAAQQAHQDETGKRPPELIEHIHGEEGPGRHEVEGEQGCHAGHELRHPATAQLARHEAGDDDDQGTGERRDDVDRHQAVADSDAQERRKPAHQQRLIDVAELEVPAIGDVVQLVTKVPVVAGDEHVGNERHPGERHQQSRCGRRSTMIGTANTAQPTPKAASVESSIPGSGRSSSVRTPATPPTVIRTPAGSRMLNA